MRIAVVGKGGSGKTTVSSLLFHTLKQQNKPLLAIDADINQHFAEAVGLSNENITELGNDLINLKTMLISNNKRIPAPNVMSKTTLPAEGSHLIKLNSDDAILKKYAIHNENTWFMRVGSFEKQDVGQMCFHGKTGAAELILNHLIDAPEDNVIVDMTAGADAFASGLFARFDMTVIAVEPTLKSVQVYHQYKKYADDYNINICVVANKIQDESDIEFIKKQCGDAVITALSFSTWVKNQERGIRKPFSELEEINKASIEKLIAHGTKFNRNWARYWELGIHFHNTNALNWANDDLGVDVRDYIDPNYLKQITPTL